MLSEFPVREGDFGLGSVQRALLIEYNDQQLRRVFDIVEQLNNELHAPAFIRSRADAREKQTT